MRYDIPKRFSDATMALVDEEQFGPVCAYAQHMKEKFLRGDGLIVTGAEGVGKCLGRGTPVLKYDGTIVPVEEVRKGDLLMGPDSKPRKVLRTNKGVGRLYTVIPTKGEPWVCNDAHIFTLRASVKKTISDVSLKDYLRFPAWKKQDSMMFQPERIDFAPVETELKISPYFLGVWLGDGTKCLNGVQITKPDPEIEQAVADEAERWGLRFVVAEPKERCRNYSIRTLTAKGKGARALGNPLLSELRRLMSGGIRIPKEYLTGSRKTRKELLAGLLDTDGCLTGGCFEVVQKEKGLADDICLLARSLGLRVTRTVKTVNGADYQRLYLLGDATHIPLRISRKLPKARKQRKDARVTGFKVEPRGWGGYYGFTLDGDGRFLLGDFTVTHNTFALAALTRHYRRCASKDPEGFGTKDYVFITAPDMFDKIAIVGDCYDTYRGQEFVTTFSTVGLLVINDLGKEYRGGKFDEQIPYKLGRILRARAENDLPTFISTNLSGPDIRSIYGASITSVLSETCKTFEVTGKDRRKKVA